MYIHARETYGRWNKHRPTCTLWCPKLTPRSQRWRGWSPAKLEPAMGRHAKLRRRVAQALLTPCHAAELQNGARPPRSGAPRRLFCPKHLQTRSCAPCLGTAVQSLGIVQPPRPPANEASFSEWRSPGSCIFFQAGLSSVPSTVSYAL